MQLCTLYLTFQTRRERDKTKIRYVVQWTSILTHGDLTHLITKSFNILSSCFRRKVHKNKFISYLTSHSTTFQSYTCVTAHTCRCVGGLKEK